MAIEPGLRAVLVHEVTQTDTAITMGSGDVAVLATPRLVALAEAACLAALGDAGLAQRTTTVGTHVSIDHLRPLAVGDAVRVSARLVRVVGRTIDFEVLATDDGDRTVATASVTRVLVDRERFWSRTRP